MQRQFKVYVPCTFTLCIVQVQASFCAIATHILHSLYYLHSLQNSCVFGFCPIALAFPHCTFRSATFHEISCENLCTIGQHVSVLYQVELVLGLHNSCSIRSDKIIIKCTKFVKLTKKFEDLGTIALPCMSSA